MAEVSAAARAAHLGARDDHLEVTMLVDDLGTCGCVEAGPPAAAVVLGAGVEELGSAPGAEILARGPDVNVLAGAGALGGPATEHRVLMGGEQLPPLLVGLDD